MIRSLLNKNILVTLNDWFYAPDGSCYKAIYGRASNVIEQENGSFDLWLDNIFINGNDIKTIIATDEVNFGQAKDWEYEDGKAIVFYRPCNIYKATYTH